MVNIERFIPPRLGEAPKIFFRGVEVAVPGQAPWLTGQLVVYYELVGAPVLDGGHHVHAVVHPLQQAEVGLAEQVQVHKLPVHGELFLCDFILIHVGGKGYRLPRRT